MKKKSFSTDDGAVAVDITSSAQDSDITITARSVAIAGFGDVSNAILRYITNVAMTHLFEPSLYGSFNEVYTVMIILGWIAKWGLDGVLICLLPIYRVKGKQELLRGLTRFAVWITLISGVGMGAVLMLFARNIAERFYHNLSYTALLHYLAPLIPLTALQLVLAAGLQALKEIKWKIWVDRLSQPLITLVTLAMFSLCGWRIQALSFATICGYLGAALIGQIALKGIIKHCTRTTAYHYHSSLWMKTAIPMIFNGLIYGILNSADILFLSVFATPAQAAIYIAADRVSSFVITPLFALNMIFSPMIAEYAVSNHYEQLEKMLKLVTKWSLSLSLPIFLACLVFHNAVLGIFGPQYVAGSTALIIICLGNVLNSATGAVLQLLVMTGRLKLVSVNSIITIIVNIGLSFLLVPRFNILGAAIAAALAVVILNSLCLVEVYWIMKIHPYRWDISKPLLASGVAYLVGVFLARIVSTAANRWSLIEQLGLLIPFFVTYALVIVLLRFSREDRIICEAIVNKFFRKTTSHVL